MSTVIATPQDASFPETVESRADCIQREKNNKETLARMNAATEGALSWKYQDDNALVRKYKSLRKNSGPVVEDSFVSSGYKYATERVLPIIRKAAADADSRFSADRIVVQELNPGEKNTPLKHVAIIVPSKIAQNDCFVQNLNAARTQLVESSNDQDALLSAVFHRPLKMTSAEFARWKQEEEQKKAFTR